MFDWPSSYLATWGLSPPYDKLIFSSGDFFVGCSLVDYQQLANLANRAPKVRVVTYQQPTGRTEHNHRFGEASHPRHYYTCAQYVFTLESRMDRKKESHMGFQDAFRVCVCVGGRPFSFWLWAVRGWNVDAPTGSKRPKWFGPTFTAKYSPEERCSRRAEPSAIGASVLRGVWT